MKKIIFILSLTIASVSFANEKKCADYSAYKDVSPTEMTALVKTANTTIVDVNSKDSYAKSHIPGAVSFYANKENFAKVLPKDKDALIVAYCGGKMCTAWQKAAEQACEMGYKNIRHFSEGITGWNKLKKG